MNYRLFLTLAFAVSAVVIFACSSSSPSPALPSKPNPQIDKNDVLKSIRYERYYKDGSFRNGKVYYLSRSDYNDGTYFYFRKQGSLNATSYSSIDANGALAELQKAVLDLNLTKYPYTSADNEKKNKRRWIVIATYRSGKEVSMVVYDDKKSNAEFKKIDDTLTGIFENQLKSIPYGASSYVKYTYKPSGKLQREMRHDNEGRVCGGWDADDEHKKYGGKCY